MKKLAIGLICVVSLYASSLEVYRDGAIYRFSSKKPFLGFLPKAAEAECGGERIKIVPAQVCPSTFRLCTLKKEIEKYEDLAVQAKASQKALHTLVQNLHPTTIDATRLIESSKKIAEQEAAFGQKVRRNESLAKVSRERFYAQSPSSQQKRLLRACEQEVSLALPSGAVGFSPLYRLYIDREGKATIEERLVLWNRSGIDIYADVAHLSYRPLYRRLRPIDFSPWIISERRPPVHLKSGVKSMRMMSMPVADVAEAHVQKPREYLLKKVSLPSNGEKLSIALRRWRQPIKKSLMVFPWRSHEVFEVLSFNPTLSLDTNRWQIFEKDKRLADSVEGAWINGHYTLFYRVDEDLIVRKKPLLFKEKESFFGTKVKKKDGYTIALVNQSKKKKRVRIIERIPVAIRSDVEVKLERVHSNLAMHYALGAKGELTIDLTLPPHAKGKVDVIFAVAFDKEKPIIY